MFIFFNNLKLSVWKPRPLRTFLRFLCSSSSILTLITWTLRPWMRICVTNRLEVWLYWSFEARSHGQDWAEFNGAMVIWVWSHWSCELCTKTWWCPQNHSCDVMVTPLQCEVDLRHSHVIMRWRGFCWLILWLGLPTDFKKSDFGIKTEHTTVLQLTPIPYIKSEAKILPWWTLTHISWFKAETQSYKEWNQLSVGVFDALCFDICSCCSFPSLQIQLRCLSTKLLVNGQHHLFWTLNHWFKPNLQRIKRLQSFNRIKTSYFLKVK